MSTRPSSRAAHDVARDLTDLYDILILQSPTRCATCHQRIRDKHELDADESHDGLGTGNRPDAILQRAGSGVIGHDVTDKDAYGAQQHYYTRTYCDDCGSPAGSESTEPADYATTFERVPPLLECLAAHDIEADADTLYSVIRHLKKQDHHSGRDTDIWRTATALAVEQTQG